MAHEGPLGTRSVVTQDRATRVNRYEAYRDTNGNDTGVVGSSGHP
jgi:hypothetical protein